MIYNNIKNERVKLVKATFGSKLGKNITDNILMPILDELEEVVPLILLDCAEWAKKAISDYLKNSASSGWTYEIYYYDPSMPKGKRTTLLDEYTASAPGQSPAMLTGTLVESIEYQLYNDGSFRIGILKDEGVFSDAMSEFESVFFKGGKIFVNNDLAAAKKTPVGTYSKYLAEGTEGKHPMDERPHFEYAMHEIREELRQKIRSRVRIALNTITRRTSVRRAVIFKVYFR